MTTGKRTIDLRSYITGTDCGNGLSGYWSQKDWSGGDWTVPPQVQHARRVREKTFKRLIPHISRSGRRYYTVEEETRLVTSYKRVSPKRIATSEEHGYTMQYNMRNDAITSYRYGSSGPILWGWTNLCGWSHNPPSDDSWTAEDETKLISKLKSRLEGTKDFHAGVFLGEGRMALQMIGESARRIATAVKHARKGNLLQAEEALVHGRISRNQLSYRKGAANNWLELQYGWLPLLSDAHSGAEMLAHVLNVPQQDVYRITRKKSWGKGTFNGGCAPRSMREFQLKSIKCIISEVNHASLSGLLDPLSVMWELTPWSFVVDWFIPIGNFLEARGIASAVTGKFVTSWFRYLEIDGLKSAGGNLTIYGNAYKRKFIRMSRTVSSSLAAPLPTFRPLKDVPSWGRAANAVALLTQLKVPVETSAPRRVHHFK